MNSCKYYNRATNALNSSCYKRRAPSCCSGPASVLVKGGHRRSGLDLGARRPDPVVILLAWSDGEVWERLCPWRLGEVLLPLPARKVTIGLILPMVAPPESGRFRVSPPSHPVSSVWTVGWSLEKLWNRVPVLGLGVWQVLFVACGGQQVPEKLEGFRRYAMISQCCGRLYLGPISLGSCLRASSVFAGFVLRISVVSLCWVRAESMLRSCSKRRRETRVRTLKRRRKTRVRVLWRRRIS
ncbi:hypothetical protein HID58_011637 [Brassica napus]|uniref:Uncharacterized protein n=1 Tax=Brassica napus TaxID=3708 RepID=A0ABQ8DYV0_BRANA|nr:hypothetical protein HID58_011637 [Brassica napus]